MLHLLQVISPHEVMGLVEVVEHLSTVQDKVYDEATVLVVHNVTGRRPCCSSCFSLPPKQPCAVPYSRPPWRGACNWLEDV
jgi:hypothetical protein